MATKSDFDALLNDVSGKLDAIQQRIADLTTKIQAGGMTADEENAVLAEVQDLQNKVNGMANPPAPTP